MGAPGTGLVNPEARTVLDAGHAGASWAIDDAVLAVLGSPRLLRAYLDRTLLRVPRQDPAPRRTDGRRCTLSEVEVGPGAKGASRPGPRRVRATLRARNERGVRTVVTTRGGLSLVTDEPVGQGGTGSAPTPLETVVGALCGCSAVTFERAARELGLAYEGIDFEAGYLLDRRGLLGQADVRPYFDTVEVDARVHTTAPAGLLERVVELTERRCPVRNLLVDAGVALRISWSAAAD